MRVGILRSARSTQALEPARTAGSAGRRPEHDGELAVAAVAEAVLEHRPRRFRVRAGDGKGIGQQRGVASEAQIHRPPARARRGRSASAASWRSSSTMP